MKVAGILLALLAIAGTTLFFQDSQYTSEEALVYAQFSDWKAKFNQLYSSEEDAYRFLVFYENYLYIKDFNSKNSFELGVNNQFAAMTNDEFKATYTSALIRESHTQVAHERITANIAQPTGSVNWVQKGAVQVIQNQGVCGSCWAFSAVSSLESLYYLNTGNLKDFSEQQVVSCDTSSYGCNGGWPETAFTYVASKGLELASTYPYAQLNNANTQSCQYNASQATTGINTSYKSVAANNPDAMFTALQSQPLSILVDGGSLVFQLYNGGVIQSSLCGTSLDHAINLVGYANGVWTVRNSWGTSWGEQGYARIAYSSGAGYCGINSSPTYPVK